MSVAHSKPADAGTTTITIGDQDWPLPKLGPKQNRIIVPKLTVILPHILASAKVEGGSMDKLASYLSQDHYDTMLEIVFTALTRGSPDLTREEFDDLPLGTLEMINALTPIARAAGLLDTPVIVAKKD